MGDVFVFVVVVVIFLFLFFYSFLVYLRKIKLARIIFAHFVLSHKNQRSFQPVACLELLKKTKRSANFGIDAMFCEIKSVCCNTTLYAKLYY